MIMEISDDLSAKLPAEIPSPFSLTRDSEVAAGRRARCRQHSPLLAHLAFSPRWPPPTAPPLSRPTSAVPPLRPGLFVTCTSTGSFPTSSSNDLWPGGQRREGRRRGRLPDPPPPRRRLRPPRARSRPPLASRRFPPPLPRVDRAGTMYTARSTSSSSHPAEGAAIRFATDWPRLASPSSSPCSC